MYICAMHWLVFLTGLINDREIRICAVHWLVFPTGLVNDRDVRICAMHWLVFPTGLMIDRSVFAPCTDWYFLLDLWWRSPYLRHALIGISYWTYKRSRGSYLRHALIGISYWTYKWSRGPYLRHALIGISYWTYDRQVRICAMHWLILPTGLMIDRSVFAPCTDWYFLLDLWSTGPYLRHALIGISYWTYEIDDSLLCMPFYFVPYI
jgi:hypothetical protein